MKYYNKNPELRKNWYHIFVRYDFYKDEMKRWCQLNGSTKRFYHSRLGINWYFEDTQDAFMFKLRFL